MVRAHHLAVSGSVVDPNQSLFTSLCVVGEEGQEIADHCNRRNIKAQVLGVVKLGEKKRQILTC